MKKALLALASVALISSFAVSAHAADIDPIKVRSVQAVLGKQKIDVIKVKKADDVSITQQVVQVNVDVESEQKVNNLKINVAALGVAAGLQDINKIKLNDVKKVEIGQTVLGTGVSVKLKK